MLNNPKTAKYHLQNTLGNYHSDCPEKNINVVERLISTDFAECDCLVIKSSEGNGGSHLINGIYNKIKADGADIINCSCEELFSEFKSKPDECAKEIKAYRYIAIDEFYSMFFQNDFLQWFENVYLSAIKEGKKFIITFTGNKTEDIILPGFIARQGRAEAILSEKPSAGTLKKIIADAFAANDFIPDNEIIAYIATLQFSSVREFQNLVIAIAIAAKTNNTDISKMSFKEFEKSFKKYFSEAFSGKQNNIKKS